MFISQTTYIVYTLHVERLDRKKDNWFFRQAGRGGGGGGGMIIKSRLFVYSFITSRGARARI